MRIALPFQKDGEYDEPCQLVPPGAAAPGHARNNMFDKGGVIVITTGNSNFRSACRGYLPQQARYRDLTENSMYLFDRRSLDAQKDPDKRAQLKGKMTAAGFEARLLRENISYVEDAFERIERKCGRKARRLLWENYVDGVPIREIARAENVSERGVMRRFGTWLREADIVRE